MITVLSNPDAGRGRHARDLPRVLTRLQKLDGEGGDAVVVIGGDGTVHRALQTVAGTGVPLGIVPTGTGNDMAACFGLPPTPLAAADTIAEALRRNKTRQVDLARVTTVDGRIIWYGAVLAAGFDAIVNERGNRMRWPRGPRRYDVAIMLELMRLRPRRYHLVLDGVPCELDAVLLAVGNTAQYGGGMRICPDADPNDGMLHVVWGDPMSRRTLVRIKPGIYQGTHVRHPAVHQARVREISIDAPDIVCYADGERLGPLPITITVQPGALTLLG
ncbi:diacylglycerol kinase family protein [Allorhizocola rhizosphaerae]|uniref:diacylglycerol kinase family protein n=1 Tax=Allorhizocola rhizosphaerae TaxID=1872709 RepID=UPI000E3BEF22|nr:diacylglycerol kinase family protein [Allorhizocola rhizosphaerae]